MVWGFLFLFLWIDLHIYNFFWLSLLIQVFGMPALSGCLYLCLDYLGLASLLLIRWCLKFSYGTDFGASEK